MNSDLQRILKGKRAFRAALAARPIGEKLLLLDAMRERAELLRNAAQRLDKHAPVISRDPNSDERLQG